MSTKTVFQKDVVDLTTGEVTSSERVIKRVVTQEQFIRTYISDICKLAKCSGAEQSIILCSLQYIDYNTNEITLNSPRRKQIAECAGIKTNTFNSCILRLYKKNILVKLNGITYLNPRLFFFGSDVEREKILKLTILYEVKEVE